MESPDSHEDRQRSSNSDEETHINRRTTLQLLAVVGGAGAFASTGGAEMDAVRRSTEAAPRAKETPVPVGTDALLSFIEATYGDRLDEDELDRIGDDIASDRRSAEALDAVELDYTVSPAVTFHAYREDDCR